MTLLLMVLLWLVFLPAASHAEDAAGFSLEANNDRCVALRQGQRCYQQINLRWQAQGAGDYCIAVQGSTESIQCWQQQKHGDVTIDFESNGDLTYVLRRENTDTPLATETITIAWVYKPKPSKSSGWRLF